RDDFPEIGQLLRGGASGPHDGVESVDVLAGVFVAVAVRDAGGERKVGGDLPEGHEGEPEHALEHVLSVLLGEPVRCVEDETGAPPDDRVGGVHQVEDPGAVPRPVRWGDARGRVACEAYGPAV